MADWLPISQTKFQEKNTRAKTEFEITTPWLVVEHRLTFPPQDNSNSDKRVRDARANTRIGDKVVFTCETLNKPLRLN
jgi:hypothetical protein